MLLTWSDAVVLPAVCGDPVFPMGTTAEFMPLAAGMASEAPIVLPLSEESAQCAQSNRIRMEEPEHKAIFMVTFFMAQDGDP